MPERVIDAKVLIVEDDEAERVSLHSSLEQSFLKVASVGSGAEAENMAKEESFDILVVDYGLPDVNGISLIKSIKNILNDIVPIVITGSSSIEIAIESIKIGAYDYVVKPLDIETLVKTINIMLEERNNLYEGRINLQHIVSDISNLECLTDDMKVNVVASPDAEIMNANKRQGCSIIDRIKGIKILKRG